MIRQLQRQGPVFWNEALRGIQPEYCINMMYTPHSVGTRTAVCNTIIGSSPARCYEFWHYRKNAAPVCRYSTSGAAMIMPCILRCN